MTPVDTNELRRLLAAASAAPWRRCQANDRKCICGLVWSLPEDATVSAFVGDGGQNATERDHLNADLIVALRNHAAALLDAYDERERLRAKLGAIRRDVDGFADWEDADAETVSFVDHNELLAAVRLVRERAAKEPTP